MTFRYLDKDGAISFWTNIKNFVLSKIPTKTSELTNDSGFLTQHQSLSNYVTLNSSQTIAGIKTITGGNQGKMIFKNPNFTVGTTPEATTTVTRIYFGGGASYDGSTGAISNDIASNGNSQLEICALNNNSSNSYRASLILRYEQDQTRPRFIKSWGDFCPYSDNTYYLGRSDLAWKDAYINNVHGISDYTNFLTSVLNANTTLTHASHGRRPVLAMGMITLTIPVPVEGSWFLIKAVNGQVTLNLASNVTVTGITAGVFSGPIYLQPNESILLCYYSSTTYNATISTIRRSGVVGRTGNVPSENPKHWFKIAENYVTATYRDPFICLRVFEGTTGNTIGTLCAHCRINNTVGVVDASNCYLQWQDAGSGIDLSKYALTTNETSGTGVTITLWCQLAGGYSSLKFEVASECGQSDQIGNPEWVLVRRRQTDGDLAELLDTDFTKIVYSTLTTLKNNTTGTASNVTGTVAIANGGTGATSRLSAIKNLTNESVASPTHFLAITTNYAKAGYTNISQVKTVLGITGDIVSHNASEFLTSHQSLSSCVKNSVVNSQTIKSTDITRGTAPSSAQTFGIVFSDNNNKYIGNIYGQYATNKSTYVGLYAYKGTTTSNSDNVSVRVGYDASGNAYTYAPTPATADNSTQIATTAFVKAQGYLTSHQSLANYVTTNTDQDITGNKNFKDLITTSGPTLWTIDTKTTDDITFLHNNAVHVEQRASGNLTDLSGGAWNIANLGIGCFFFRINNGTDIRYKNLAQNTVNRIPVVSNANRFINDVTPNENNTYSLGTSSLQWKNAYAVNFYENGTALSDKYLTVSAISGGASTSAGNITPVKGTIISGFAESDSVTYSTNFGGVLTSPSRLFYATCVYDTSNSTMTYYKGPSVGGTGTWKLMGGGVSNPGSSTKLLFGLWVKIV